MWVMGVGIVVDRCGGEEMKQNVKPKVWRLGRGNSVCAGMAGGVVRQRAGEDGLATPTPGQHHHPAGSEGLSAWLSAVKMDKTGL